MESFQSSENKYLLSLEFDKITRELSQCAKTLPGKESAKNLVPYKDKNEIIYQINLTTEAKKILDNEGINSIPVDFAINPDDILTTRFLSVNNIIDLTKMLVVSRKLKNFLSKQKEAVELNLKFSDSLLFYRELEDKIFSVFDNDFNVKDNASSELLNLKISLNAQYSNLKNTINSLLKDSTFTSCLQDTVCTERMGRTVFQVKAANKSKVKGIVHDVSSTGQTFFIEPDVLVKINNKIKEIECGIEDEIERITAELSAEFHKIKRELIFSYKAILEIDLIFAKAKYSIQTNSTPPVISDKKIVKLRSMFHPLLKNSLNLVKNDFELGVDFKSLLITGSNTGGKTVSLKTAGVIILMAKTGMHVTASYAEIFPFKNVYSDIEERQDITQSLSTFSAHIKNIASIVDIAAEDDLVLFDELGAGTDPEEGAAIARSLIEYLNSKNILTVSTTHLGELKILEYQNKDFKNASVEFNKDTMMPSYKLTIGLAGSSYAIDIAKNFNLKEEIVNNARKILNKNLNPDLKMFNQIQETHQKLLSDAQKIEKSKISFEEKEKELNEEVKEIKEKKKKALNSFKKKYQSVLDTAREEIKETLEELRKEKSEKIARRAYSKLAKLEINAREQYTRDENELQDKYPSIDWNKIQIGQSVLVIDINQPAVIKSFPDSKGMVAIEIGLIKSKVHKSKLAKTNKKVPAQIKKLNVSFDDFHEKLTFPMKLDLRGMRVEEAIDSLERYLDLAVLRNINQFTVIHGYGTGALKKSVREYLGSNPYVLKFRPGEEAEGGDGVCIVDVK